MKAATEVHLRKIDQASTVPSPPTNRVEKVRQHPYNEYTQAQRDAVAKELREVMHVITQVQQRYEELAPKQSSIDATPEREVPKQRHKL